MDMIAFHLKEELKGWLDAVAEETGCSQAAIIHQALQEFLARKTLERLQRQEAERKQTRLIIGPIVNNVQAASWLDS